MSISPYLAYISPISPPYLPYISGQEAAWSLQPLVVDSPYISPISPVYLPYISLYGLLVPEDRPR